MKLISPAHMPMSRPKLEPDRPQSDRIEGAEDQAQRRLPAHEARQGVIHVAADPTHRRAVPRRHPAVDRGDHAVPVDEEVEGHHRRHDEEREHAHHRLAAAPDRAGEGGHPIGALPDEIADGALQLIEGLLAAEPAHQRPTLLRKQVLQPRDVARQLLGEACHLV
jgi:hypothetical protein